MIKLTDAAFKYDKKIVLENLHFMENSPSIIGLWGRNGAGKTTVMKLIAGQCRPTAGSVEVLGSSPYNNAALQGDICFMQEDSSFSAIWDVRDALRFGRLFNRNWDQEEALSLAERFHIPLNNKISKLSKGMKSAVQIIIGLASHARVTILDEPANGLDAGMRKVFQDCLLESYEDDPRILLISSHHIEEIQAFCESLMVIADRTILLYDKLDTIRGRGIWLSGEAQSVESMISGHVVLNRRFLGNQLRVLTDAPYPGELGDLAESLGVTAEKVKLEEYLLYITGNGEGKDEHI